MRALLAKAAGRFEDAVFLEVRLDIFFHEQNRTLTSGSGRLNAKFRSRSRLSSGRSRRLSGMSEHVYKKIELVGSSTTSIEEAVKNALSLAAKTIRNMRWFEVVETRGHIEENKINHWQVTVKVGFTLDK